MLKRSALATARRAVIFCGADSVPARRTACKEGDIMPLIKSNVHTHTTFCDGQDSMEDMVKAAVSLGFDTLGFSFHSYTPFDPSYCIRDYYSYMREFERLKGEYADRISLLNGVELDLYGERPSVCDFVIGSVHYLEENGKRYPVDFSARGFKKLVEGFYRSDALAAAERYYAEICELIKNVKPDVYGHFDLITRFNRGGAFFDEGSARYKRAALSAVESLPAGAVVEVNLGRLFKGEGGMYPSAWLTGEMLSAGCRFMLSSDAHCTAALGYGFDEACSALKKLGVKSLVRYKGASLKEVEL